MPAVPWVPRGRQVAGLLRFLSRGPGNRVRRPAEPSEMTYRMGRRQRILSPARVSCLARTIRLESCAMMNTARVSRCILLGATLATLVGAASVGTAVVAGAKRAATGHAGSVAALDQMASESLRLRSSALARGVVLRVDSLLSRHILQGDPAKGGGEFSLLTAPGRAQHKNPGACAPGRSRRHRRIGHVVLRLRTRVR